MIFSFNDHNITSFHYLCIRIYYKKKNIYAITTKTQPSQNVQRLHRD